MTTSTRWTRAWGKSLISTAPVTVEATERRPSSSTRVRGTPSPRRLSALTPAVPELIEALEDCGETLPASAGI